VDMPIWAQCIGGLVINFGSSELLAFHWMEKLNGRVAALKSLNAPFAVRIKKIQAAISTSSLPKPDKTKLLNLWREVAGFIGTRNRVAHNPILQTQRVINGELILSIIDKSRLTLDLATPMKELSQLEIHDTAIRVAQLNMELGSILNAQP